MVLEWIRRKGSTLDSGWMPIREHSDRKNQLKQLIIRDTVGIDEEIIRKYVKFQEKEESRQEGFKY